MSLPKPSPRTASATLTRIGRFYITRELASGSAGTVYLARDPVLDREVAVKTFGSKLPPLEKKKRERYLINEARAAGRLSHPNIITIFDACADSNITYIAMEYLQGQELSLLLDKGHRFSYSDVASIVWRLADALAYAHQNEVVHRDLKPANIFMVSDRNPKIVDFGIARAPNRLPDEDSDLDTEDNPHTLFKNNLLGTPNYMSPEQAQGKPADERSDIYSLGAVMYEMLTSRKPFQAKTTEDLLQAIAYKAPPPPNELNDRIPEELSAIVMKAMSKKAEKRYQTAGEMAEEIKNYMSKERRARRMKKSAESAFPPSQQPQEEPDDEARNVKKWIVAAALGAISVAAAIVWLR